MVLFFGFLVKNGRVWYTSCRLAFEEGMDESI